MTINILLSLPHHKKIIDQKSFEVGKFFKYISSLTNTEIKNKNIGEHESSYKDGKDYQR